MVAGLIIAARVSCCSFTVSSIIEAKILTGANIMVIPDTTAWDESIGATQLVPVSCR